jgi:NTE family protein
MVRGELVGEMALLTNEPRSASVVALRDTLLVEIPKIIFEEVAFRYPQAFLFLTQKIIQRLKRKEFTQIKKTQIIVIVPLQAHLKFDSITKYLQYELPKNTTSTVLAQDFEHNESSEVFTHHLNDLTQNYDFLLLEGHFLPDEWTQKALRQADLILWVADAKASSDKSPTEQWFHALPREYDYNTKQHLILLQTQGKMPQNTSKWLTPRPNIALHHHIRPYEASDWARLARFVSGTAVGWVLAGGGARGFAHLGVFKALTEGGVPLDLVGGTSMGAIMGGIFAQLRTFDDMLALSRQVAKQNPTSGDLNPLPFISLLRGKKLHKILKHTFGDMHIEDLWLNLFCVSSSLSRACEVVHRRGILHEVIKASSAIPGIFPPVIHKNELLVDGGIFNNFPADVMRRMGVGKVLGIDMLTEQSFTLEVGKSLKNNALPNGWDFLKASFWRQKKHQTPNLLSILARSSLLYSEQRNRDLIKETDYYIPLDMGNIGLLDWYRFEEIFEKGYQQTKTWLNQHDLDLS